jgi:cytochrome c peroxidase
MIRWTRVKTQRLLSLCVVVSSVGGCWTEDRIGGVFTEEQLDKLRAQFQPIDPLSPCEGVGTDRCDIAQKLGHALFFDKQLAKNDAIACISCHAPGVWYAENRQFSQGATKLTGRNTISVVNLAFKTQPDTFTWSGDQSTANAVITSIALPKAMATFPRHVAHAIVSNPVYDELYRIAFPLPLDRIPALPSDAVLAQDGADPSDSNFTTVQSNVARAFVAYMRQLNSTDTPFDRFIAGDDAALSEPQLRGFGVFVGAGMCVECHSGWLFSDNGAHVTGVPNRPGAIDTGHGGSGAFLTSPLRHVAKTGPYMHDGSIATLSEVVTFYREGGWDSGYPKDKLMAKLDITDDDARDLVAFLESLTGKDIDPALTVPPPPPDPQMPMTCTVPNQNQGLICNGVCTNVTTDRNNCGACGNVCAGDQVCMGTCFPLNCGPSMLGCNGMCVDTMADPMNCGGCGNACPTSAPTCAGGMCKP